MNFVNWYRVRIPHDSWSAKDVGKLFTAEGTPRMAAMEAMGYVEQVVELQPQPVLDDPRSVLAARVAKERPVGSPVAKARRRRGTVETGPGEGAGVRLGEGGSSRGEDSPADGDSSETPGSDEESGSAA